jgi:hypothetical protein
MGDSQIRVAPDAPPTALGLAATLRRAASDRRLGSTMSKLHGRIAMRSDKDAQAATVRFDRGSVEVVGGVDPDAQVIITADFETLGLPGAPKPKVSGALRHPIFALRAGKVLEPKVPGGWRGAVEDFGRRADGRPGMPDPLLVVCTDDSSELRLGGDGPPAVELHGSADVLTAVFTSAVHPGQAWLAGQFRMLSDQRALQLFSGLAQDLMMGV